jgi:RES domain-containing protein
VRVYRLCKEKYSASVLDGQGGLAADGRWHTRGRRIVYCASSEALAVLEVRVHVGRHVPAMPYVMHAIDVPDELVTEIAQADLPGDWNAVPFGAASQSVGDAWLASARSAALRVPSVHSGSDATVLLNPAHPAYDAITVATRTPYAFDPRLFVRRPARRGGPGSRRGTRG